MNNNNNSNFGDLLASHSTNNNNHNKLTILNIGSLSCRSPAKLSLPEKRQSFVRHLRLQSLDILSLDDTNAKDETCLNPSITVTPTLVTVDQRLIIYEISYTRRMSEPFTLVNLYAPLQHCRLQDWHSHVQQYFFDYMTADTRNPTFQRTASSSTIDYIYATPDLHTSLINSIMDFVCQDWTDHLLLAAKFKFTSRTHGKAGSIISGANSNYSGYRINEIVDNAALKAGKHWRKKCELSADFLKRAASTCLSQTYIAKLRHPETNEVCITPNQLQAASITFYEWLYTPQPTCPSAMNQLLNAVTSELRISQAQSTRLLRPFTVSELQEAAKRCQPTVAQALLVSHIRCWP
ncbi:hypothetical protein G6F70_006619 [Rhizopus microsporus]|nr:hypothetical protein G6F71_001110 [Rhizopus microsporus]KAG1197451.1 hypothetical protein G6F70_006619 [Rhizopus microsporus]KAG1212667.1 hypothetical protein G6F69_003521 [Rhizopus microsporus]KAG1230672.1 hypothetical protein G6F67_006310 [Rhizopus microsporus]KAG1258001.1 hypothetical protein G6F68_009015 [Rhizopus microsporus]